MLTARRPELGQKAVARLEREGLAALSSTDAWSVGQWARFAGKDYYHALIEHWDGTAWKAVDTPHPSLPISVLSGVAALSSTDVRAVGYEEDLRSGYRTLIEHWDGSNWTIVQDATYLGWLVGVAANAPNDVWAVGSTNYIGEGLIEHWNGTTWTKTVPRDPIFFRSVTVLGSNDVWAVGQLSHDGFGDYTYAAHFDGNTWAQVLTPSPLQEHKSDQNWLTSVTAIATNDIWAVGLTRHTDFGILDRTLTIHWDGSVWTEVPSPVLGHKVNNDLWGALALGPDNIWAVGATGVDPDFVLLIEHWDGTAWAPVATAPSGGVLLGIAGLSSNGELWANGYKPKRDRYTGTFAQHLCHPE